MSHPVDVPMTCYTWLHHALPDVRKAMEDAWYKHGEPTKDPLRGATNLMEEAGEVASEALDATRITLDLHDQGHALMMMRYELMQVAAYAILLAVQLEGTIRKVERDQPQP